MDTINDPAWFYSSLAQSAAAIAGLLGAVLGSRIIDHIGVLRAKRQELDDLMTRAFQANDSELSVLQGLRDFIKAEITEDDSLIKKGAKSRRLQRDRTWTTSTTYGGGYEVDLAPHKATLEEELLFVEKLLTVYSPLSGPFNHGTLSSYTEQVRESAAAVPGSFRECEAAQNRIRGHADLLTNVMAQVEDFRRQLLPKSFTFVFVLVAWLLLTGVFWPLAALPGLANSLATAKTGMLLALGAGLVGLVGYFLFQFIELTRLGRLTWSKRT
jgi:hypothetical protein